MNATENNSFPSYAQLTEATFKALKELGGSGKNDEINDKAVSILKIPNDILELSHLNSDSISEINYRLAWARNPIKELRCN